MKPQSSRDHEIARMKAASAFADHCRIIREKRNAVMEATCTACAGAGYVNPDGTRSAGLRADSIVCSACKGSGKPAPTENRIVSFGGKLQPDGTWIVTVTKEFAPEHGGGLQAFQERAGAPHHALDVLRGMVTWSPAQRTDFCEAMDASLPDGICRAPAVASHEGIDGVSRRLCLVHKERAR